MATKNNPGRFDCHKNAEPDEPMFVLLGRDPVASLTVVFWVKMRIELGQTVEEEQIEEARECARALEAWAREKGKSEKVEKALEAFRRIVK